MWASSIRSTRATARKVLGLSGASRRCAWSVWGLPLALCPRLVCSRGQWWYTLNVKTSLLLDDEGLIPLCRSFLSRPNDKSKCYFLPCGELRIWILRVCVCVCVHKMMNRRISCFKESQCHKQLRKCECTLALTKSTL